MTAPNHIRVAPDAADQRLDRWFKIHFPNLPRVHLQKLLRTGQIRVDGARAKAGTRLQPGQDVRLPPGLTAQAADRPEAAQARRAAKRPGPPPNAAERRLLLASILYRDPAVTVLNKPPGLAVQGGSGQARHLDALLRDWPEENGTAELARLHLVHRLDKDTSGVLVLAQGAANARLLTRSFRDKSTRKLYWALVLGKTEKRRGYIDVPLAARAGPGGDKSRPDPAGQAALTLYCRVAAGSCGGVSLSWLALMPVSGRKHQLRAHLEGLGHPILGDGKYGGRRAHPKALAARPWAGRLHLHAREIALPHPQDGTTLRVAAPLPEHMAAAWQDLAWEPAWGEAAADDLATYAESLLPRLAAASSGGAREVPRESIDKGGTAAARKAGPHKPGSRHRRVKKTGSKPAGAKKTEAGKTIPGKTKAIQAGAGKPAFGKGGRRAPR